MSRCLWSLVLIFGALFAGAEGTVRKESLLDSLDNLRSTADPDYPCFSLSYMRGRPDAMFGANIGLYSVDTQNVRAVVFLTPFLNLYSHSGGLIPWSLWRGSLGAKCIVEPVGLLPAGQRLLIKAGFTHESDHYTGSGVYVYDSDYYMERYRGDAYWLFADTGFSFYNYIDPKLIYEADLFEGAFKVVLSGGVKYNLDDVFMLRSDRNIKYAYDVEAILRARIDGSNSCFVSFFYEKMFCEPYYSFSDASLLARIALIPQSVKQQQQYLHIRLGLDLAGDGRFVYQPYITYSSSNGKGIDYLLSEQVFGFGIRLLI